MLEVLWNEALKPTTVIVIVAPIVFYYLYATLFAHKSFDVPKYVLASKDPNQSKFNSLDDIMRVNYFKDRNHIYKVEQPHKDVVIIPAKYVDELKSLPVEQVDFLADIDERFLGRYTKMIAPGGLSDLTLLHTVKNNLTRNIGKIMEDVQAEIAYAFSTEVGECSDWTAVQPMSVVMRIIALVSGRVFAGSQLNRREEYLECAVMFAIEVFNISEAMRKYPTIFRPLAQYWNPGVAKTDEYLATMERLLAPVIANREMSAVKPNDMLTWIMENCPPGKANDIRWQALYQLQISTAAIHTTSTTISHVWFDLAARPEYLNILREEVLTVMATETKGVMTKTSMPKLKKLDSFIKESQRMSPFSSTSFSRKIMKDTRMKDGTVFPAGVTITTPVSQISMDPEIYENPEVFDGLRFFKLRMEPGNESRFQYVTTSKENLNWGHGEHACPGRFFASSEIKIIMIHLILNYDIKLPDGERPKNMWTEGSMVPDGTKMVELKKR